MAASEQNSENDVSIPIGYWPEFNEMLNSMGHAKFFPRLLQTQHRR